MRERPLVHLRNIPIGRAFRTPVTERIGVRVNQGGLWGIRVDLGPSEHPDMSFAQEDKRICAEVMVEPMRVCV